MRRALLMLLCLLGALAAAGPASARWDAGGGGAGNATVVTMPTGATPAGSVSGRSVTVSWAQNDFVNGNLGAAGGAYTITRYAEGGTTPVTPGTGCSSAITGTAATLSCTESSVPDGRWQYRITPFINSFTGTEGPPSPVAVIAQAAPASPTLTSATAQNPAPGATDGPIGLNWTAVAGVSGYNVYRRTMPDGVASTTPLNGATLVTGQTFSDSTATGGATYEYFVRAVAGSPGVSSDPSNRLTAKVVTRPAPPAGTVTATAGTGGAIDVSWASVSGVTGYNVYRHAGTGAFAFTAPLNGATPTSATTFKDSTAAAGVSYRYVIRSVLTGAGGTPVESTNSSESAALSCTSSYGSTITAAAYSHFRLGETGGTVAANATGASQNGTYVGGVSFGQPGAIGCDASPAVAFDGSTAQLGAAATTAAVSVGATQAVTLEVWFKTTTTAGGKLIGLGNARTGASKLADRHIYMTNNGELAFAVSPASRTVNTILSPSRYNDGAYHMAAATVGTTGLRLYVDGAEVAADPAATAGDTYAAFVRVGYDSLTGASPMPTSAFFKGTLDEPAVFGAMLTPATIASHYAAGRP